MLEVSELILQQIKQHGQQDYPYECCGLLLGKFEYHGAKSVSEIIRISNAREETAKRRRFLIRPDEWLKGKDYASERGLDVIGVYHSHPDHPPAPSGYDLEHAWPVYSYIIVSVVDGEARELASWELKADRSGFDPEEVVERCFA